MTHFDYSFKNLGNTFQLKKELFKTEKIHDEVDCNKYKYKKDEGLDYAKQDVLCIAFSYARYCIAIEEFAGFSMKDCFSAPGWGWKYFNIMREENDEPIYIYGDKYMRHFIRRSVTGGRVCSFNQYYKSKICGDILKILSEALNVKGNVYDFIEAYLNYKNKLFKIYEK